MVCLGDASHRLRAVWPLINTHQYILSVHATVVIHPEPNLDRLSTGENPGRLSGGQGAELERQVVKHERGNKYQAVEAVEEATVSGK